MTLSPLLSRLARNTAHNGLAALAALLSGLLVTPALLKSLGPERFGVWALLWAATGSLGLVDMRLASALTPLSAEAEARGDRAVLPRLVATCGAFYLLLGLLELSAASLLLRFPWTLRWLPEALRGEAAASLLPAVAVLAINALGTVFIGFLQGLQRYDLTSRTTAVVTLLRAAGLVLTARSGGGLPALLRVEICVSSLQLLALGILSARRFPIAQFFPDASSLRRLASFGGKMQVAHWAHTVSLHADKLLISAFLDLKSVAYYELGSKAAMALRALPLLLISATTPAAAGLSGAGDRPRLRGFFVEGTRLLFLASLPLLLLALFGAEVLLTLWTGSAPPQAALALRVLFLGQAFNLSSGMAYSVALGLGRPEFEMRRGLAAAVLNPLLSASLLAALGFAGAPIGTALTLLFGALYLTHAVGRDLGVPMKSFLRRPDR